MTQTAVTSPSGSRGKQEIRSQKLPLYCCRLNAHRKKVKEMSSQRKLHLLHNRKVVVVLATKQCMAARLPRNTVKCKKEKASSTDQMKCAQSVWYTPYS